MFIWTHRTALCTEIWYWAPFARGPDDASVLFWCGIAAKVTLCPALLLQWWGMGLIYWLFPLPCPTSCSLLHEVLSGPLKAGQRALRVAMLYTYHQEFVQDAEAAQRVSADAKLPLYAPPVPSLATYIAVQSKVFAVNELRPPLSRACFKMWA